MSEPEYVVETRRWLRYAREDLTAAEGYPSQSTLSARHACFLAQQAAEKAIKAVLVYLRAEVPRIHDLDALRNLVPKEWPFTDEFPNLSRLSSWAVTARYPDLAPEATDADAKRANAEARAVLNAITRDLAQRGLTNEPQ
jgi:HEPN domain-containing protein